ncbi:MAG TPA: hypothetical protein PLZ55_12360, partial [bacterium]|nr:hypothetical protein [bacterium]
MGDRKLFTSPSCHRERSSGGAGDWGKESGGEVPPPKIGRGKVGVDRIAGGVTLRRQRPSVPRPVIASGTPAEPVIGIKKA